MILSLRSKARRGLVGRRGVTLIEAMAIVSIGAILTGIVVSAMTALFRYDKHIRAHASERGQLQMLAQMLRDDIRKATRSDYDAAEQVLTLRQDREESVSYRWLDKHFERTTETGEGATTRRYLVPAVLSVEVAPVEAERGELVLIRFSTDHEAATATEARVSPDWNLEIQAAIGRDARPLRQSDSEQAQP
jgi:hypothetical protein